MAQSSKAGSTGVLTTAASIAAGLGREMTIEVSVIRRLRTIEQQRQQRQRRDRTTTDFQEIREELLSIAQDTSDRLLRDRLIGICDRMAAQITPSWTPTSRLTCRERDVLTRIALGHTNLEVAEQLSIMPTTVKTYLKNTMRKLGTRNRVQTIHAARRAGLLK